MAYSLHTRSEWKRGGQEDKRRKSNSNSSKHICKTPRWKQSQRQDMLEKFDQLLIKQTSAQIKLHEAWKESRDPNYLINLMKTMTAEREEPSRNMWASTRMERVKRSIMRDAGKLWNQAPTGKKKHQTKSPPNSGSIVLQKYEEHGTNPPWRRNNPDNTI